MSIEGVQPGAHYECKSEENHGPQPSPSLTAARLFDQGLSVRGWRCRLFDDLHVGSQPVSSLGKALNDPDQLVSTYTVAASYAEQFAGH